MNTLIIIILIAFTSGLMVGSIIAVTPMAFLQRKIGKECNHENQS